MTDTSPERVAEVVDDLLMERAFGRAGAGPVCSDAIAMLEALAAERDAALYLLDRLTGLAREGLWLNPEHREAWQRDYCDIPVHLTAEQWALIDATRRPKEQDR